MVRPLLREIARRPAKDGLGLDGSENSALSDLHSIGFTCIHGRVPSKKLEELRSEALRARCEAKAVQSTSCHGYRAHLSGLGDAGRDFLSGNSMAKLMEALFCVPLVLERDASCYTYYGPGDFLGAHVDHAEQCVVTAILYLDVVRPDPPSERTGLELCILGAEPAGSQRAPRAVFPTEIGALIVGLGSAHWHERPVLQDGEHLTAITSCYHVAAEA